MGGWGIGRGLGRTLRKACDSLASPRGTSPSGNTYNQYFNYSDAKKRNLGTFKKLWPGKKESKSDHLGAT